MNLVHSNPINSHILKKRVVTTFLSAMIRADSAIMKDVPSNTLIAGNAARIIKKLDQPGDR